MTHSTTSNPRTRAQGSPHGGRLEPVSMEEAVGYTEISCEAETPTDGALVLKHDRLFLIATAAGEIEPPGRCRLGLFHDDTRVLSHYALQMLGGPPSLLSSQVIRPYAAQIDLAISDHAFGGSTWDPKHAIHIRRELVLGNTLLERLRLTNYLTSAVDYWLELRMACDFADIFEIRGWKRARRGQFYAPHTRDRCMLFTYRGTDHRLIQSGIAFHDAPEEQDGRRARWLRRLEPSETVELLWETFVDTAPEGGESKPHIFRSAAIDERRHTLLGMYDRWNTQCTRWHSDVEVFDATLGRAIDDLRALYVEADGEQVISAGIPWYSTVFGRDAIITSLQTLSVNPRIARDTLRYLARRQGAAEEPQTEEQPGRIMHELRRGEMARSGEIPHVPYYGTIDATPLWLILLHETWRWTGDDAIVHELLPNVSRALDWIDHYGDADGDGLVEYVTTSKRGLVNQGWKDSGDGVPFPDGALPVPPIALVEVQGYVYDAKLRTAALLERFGDESAAARLRREAEVLRGRVLDQFWMEESGTFALALDGEKKPVPTVTTNAGHLLWSRLPDAHRAARMTDVLLGEDMFSGWGIRTLSARHPVFNPMSYHDGSIWPHDNALVVMGLAHYGLSARAMPVITALHDAAANLESHRLPELYCGMRRGNGVRPVLYPVSCAPQAWASGALFMMLQSVLGIFPEAEAGVLHVRNPMLPAFLRELTVSGLAVGRSRVSLHFGWHGDRTLVHLYSVDGDPIQVRIELS